MWLADNVSTLEDIEKPKTHGTSSAKVKALVEKQWEADGANLIRDILNISIINQPCHHICNHQCMTTVKTITCLNQLSLRVGMG